MNRDNILFVLKLPPPVHGSTLMNSLVFESKKLHSEFNCFYLKISFSKDTSTIGKKYFSKIFKLFKYIRELLSLLDTSKPKLCYFALSPSGIALLKDLILIFFIKRNNIPIVYHLHGKGTKRFAQKSFVNRVAVEYIFKDENTICLSKNLVSDIEHFTNLSPFIVPNGIKNVITKKCFDKGGKPPNFVFLSNFIISKGIILFLKALKSLREEGLLFTFSLIGKSIDIKLEEITELIIEYKIQERLIFLGPKFEDEKLNHLLDCDVLVFPTYYEKETFGLVLLEAMQCSLPVIGTELGAIPEIIKNNETGFVVPQNDLDALKDKMRILLANPKLRKKMGLKARKRFEKYYTMEIFENNLAKTINAILN